MAQIGQSIANGTVGNFLAAFIDTFVNGMAQVVSAAVHPRTYLALPSNADPDIIINDDLVHTLSPPAGSRMASILVEIPAGSGAEGIRFRHHAPAPSTTANSGAGSGGKLIDGEGIETMSPATFSFIRTPAGGGPVAVRPEYWDQR